MMETLTKMLEDTLTENDRLKRISTEDEQRAFLEEIEKLILEAIGMLELYSK